ncbi:MAG: cation-translocating P-type ATPase [Aquiluna sp.]|nr:cation-translocating P-type ATPase [Aquiluna sp.]
MPNPELLELEIEGMTCTACARRVEKNLNQVPGVSAYVDFATEKAHLQFKGEYQLEELKKAVESAGYKVGDGKPELQTLRPRLIVGAILATLAALFEMVPQLMFSGSQYLVWLFATPVFFYVAYPFHSAAIKNLRHKDATMDTLVSLGSSVAYFYSVFLVLSGDTHSYFEVSAVVPAVVLLGRYIEVKARRSATDSVRALLSAIPETATIEVDGKRQEVPTHTIRKGAIVFIAAGERIPVDGKLLTANASIDNSTLTGESLPQELTAGASLSAGATSLSGEIGVEAQSSSSTSRLSRIADLVREATSQKSKLASLTDSISKVFVPSVIVIAILTFLVWWLAIGDPIRGFEAAIAVLVIACPCALGIAVPMSLTVATSIGTKRSVVIRNPDSLRLMARIDKVVFDKTGTLTDGSLKIVASRPVGNQNLGEALALAAAVERGSKHPVAKAIAALDQSKTAEEITELAGRGMQAEVAGRLIQVEKPGSYQNQAELDQLLQTAGPNTLVVVAWDGQARALLELSDEIRIGAIDAIDDLTALGISSEMLSGDNLARVSHLAKELGIKEFKASVTPEQKLEHVKGLTNAAMVGDGINDVAALASADVGIAMGSGAHAAQAASAVTILDDDPRAIPFALKLGKKTYRNIWQNLGWAFGYNLLLIPVAAIGLLNPMLAGAAMAFSSVSVVANAMRLRWQNSSR